MNFKRILAASTACVLAAGSFAACSAKKNDGPSEQAKDKAEEVKKTQAKIEAKFDAEGAELEVLTNRTDRVDDGLLKELAKPFEEAYNCKVKFVGYTNYDMDTLKRMKTDDYGDVLCISTMVKQDQLKDYFVSLGTVDELSETYRWADKKKGTDDQVYGLATGGTATGILYNKTIWAEAGYTDDKLPTTPEGFIQALKDIGEKTDAIPYYTNFAAADWPLSQFQNLVNSAAGGADAENDMLANKEGIFDKGNGYYEVYKFMFDLFSTSEILEQDHDTTDWEGSKVWFGEGKIATMVMGSWAVQQFIDVAKQSGLDPSCVGYMPAPIPAPDGKIYSEIAPDYTMGVSNKSENQELAIEFLKWWLSDSGYAQAEAFIPTKVGSDLPDTLASFTNAVLFEKTPAPEELDGKFDEIDKESKVSVWGSSTADHFRTKIAKAAFEGKSEDEFNKIIEEVNKQWIDATKTVLG